MRDKTLRRLSAVLVGSALGAATVVCAPPSRADVVGYLVNVTVRPGYDFPTADAAVAYGRGICEKIGNGRRYADIVRDVEADFATTDEFQASYLIGQAADQLCPAQLWRLRQSV